MGQEISHTHFDQPAFERFSRRLHQETDRLAHLIEASRNRPPETSNAGLELELWLIDANYQPTPLNESFLARFANPAACAELARFNIEFNTRPVALTGAVFGELLDQLQTLCASARATLSEWQADWLMIGILPTLKPEHLTSGYMSNLKRYQALNAQILKARDNRPIHLDIVGLETLKLEHANVMLESAATSLQIHLETPIDSAHHYYNASLIGSAPIVAIAANAPILFGKKLWHETRIPLFEQAVEAGGYGGAARGPLKRVSFGTRFVRESILECFHENLEHFPVILPENLGPASDRLEYLKMHNGTIWRWNRPLAQVDDNGRLTLRIEHRSPSAGPTLMDTMANAAFYYGLTRRVADHIAKHGLELTFAQAKDNFYRAAQHGLDSTVTWLDGRRYNLRDLVLNSLLSQAASGLAALGVDKDAIEQQLSIIRRRVESRQTGSQWQRQFLDRHPGCLESLTRCYHSHQNSGKPVSEWPLN